jgi:hypothetical protein
VSLPGQTLLGLAQSLLGVGPATVAVAGLAAVGIAFVLGRAWWPGGRADAGQHLQLALLPIASILIATRAGTYELTLWLAPAWLLLEHARLIPRQRRFSLVLLFVGWWGGDLASLADRGSGFEWGTVAGLIVLCGIAWQLRVPTPAASSSASGSVG